MQRVGGPVAHYACSYQADTIAVMAVLERRACPLDNQGNDSEAHVAPGGQGAPALVCRGAGVLQQSTGKQSGRYPFLAFTFHILVDRVQQSRLSSEA